VLSAQERQVRQGWARRRKTAQALALRSRIVLFFAYMLTYSCWAIRRPTEMTVCTLESDDCECRERTQNETAGLNVRPDIVLEVTTLGGAYGADAITVTT
jgi:hypothetical protein